MHACKHARLSQVRTVHNVQQSRTIQLTSLSRHNPVQLPPHFVPILSTLVHTYQDTTK